MGEIRPDYGKYIPKPNKTGYLRVWRPNHPVANKGGLALIHRIVWYDNRGEIPKGYHIHHIDSNKLNNSIENLELLSSSHHQIKHTEPGAIIKNQYGTYKVKPVEDRISYKKLLKKRIRICLMCKQTFSMKRIDAKYCSSNCRVRFCKQNAKLGLR